MIVSYGTEEDFIGSSIASLTDIEIPTSYGSLLITIRESGEIRLSARDELGKTFERHKLNAHDFLKIKDEPD